MRLFCAINFELTEKKVISDVMNKLRLHTISGSFVRQENLHLTLAFLGETNLVDAAKEALDQVTASPFSMTLEGIGRFQHREGDVYWMGVTKSPELGALQRQLASQLKKRGFMLDKRPFRPHLTLARRVVVENEFSISSFSQEIPPQTVHIQHIHLMRSQHLDKKLTYTRLHSHALQNNRW